MKPTKAGEIVRFHTPFEDEDPNNIYVIIEIHLDVNTPRCKIKALDTGLKFPPINVVKVDDLETIN